MATRQATPPLDGDANVRKRVCKACDRCRLKKSKCDGTTPCSRCRSDNTICVFGERKKSHDKIYPKGYVEMLEHQQTQLVNGLQILYRRLVEDQHWEGPPLNDCSTGRPLTHDILATLGVLQLEPQCKLDSFEEDTDEMMKKLVSEGADMMQRRPSVESECDRESTVSWCASNGPHLLYNGSFVPNQLPTPPLQSPTNSQFTRSGSGRKWPPVQNINHSGPPTLQWQSGYSDWVTDEDSNAAMPHPEDWSSFMNLDGLPPEECFTAYDGLDASSGTLSMSDWACEASNPFSSTRTQ
ncbi:hypothetical protein MMC26_006556 [Xylographa opegraphella]|nr:hypothetical protein [Xylographa opegraphella]